MSENRGIFSLEEFYDLQVSGETTNIFEVFRYVNSVGVPENSGGPAYAYAAGGFPGPNTIIDRIDYASDTSTASPKGNLSSAKGWGEATGNTSYAYVGGGNPDGTKVDRVDYASDTSTASPKGNLSQARYYLSAAGNTSYGWWAGGAVGGGEGSTIDRKDYASDTTTNSVRGTLTVAKRLYASGTGNLSYGYFSGGATTNSGGYVSTVERVEYSNDASTASPKGPLTSATGYSSATGNSDYGYVGGGSPASTPNRSTIDRIDFGNDTATTLARSNLPYSGGYGTATGSSNFGYWIGSSSNKSQVNRLDYSNDTAQTVTKGPLSANKYSSAGSFSAQAEGLSSSATLPVPATRTEIYPTGGPAYGYMGGGYNPSAVQSGINRIDYSNDTATASKVAKFTGAPWPQQQNLFGISSLTHAYWGGGTHTLGSESSAVFRLDLANDTTDAPKVGPLSAVGSEFSAVGNASYGYVNGDSKSRVDRIDYSSDSSTTAVKGNLNQTRVYPGATGNSSYGWFGGGNRSSVDRVDYSNDTATASARGNLTSSRSEVAATGNSSYGYWGGGGPGTLSKVERIDYASDTSTASPKGPLATARTRPGATGNSSYGYWGGGQTGPGTKLSLIERIDYSNDSATASPKGNMDVEKHALAGASANANGLPSNTKTVDKGAEGYTVAGPLGPAYGYWIGGGGGGSQYNRVDFSNDTGTAGVRGNLDRSVDRNASVSSLNYSYTVGGWSNTNISRIDYADDTATATPKGNLPPISGLSSPAGVDTINYGYICGGLPLTTVNRIDFSNDTAVASAKGPLTATRRYISATGNSSYGYVIAGTPPDKSSTDRIDFSNDSVTATVKGNLPYNIQANGATGNADYGYVTGGFNIAPGNNNWISSTSRIDYANDTATASPKGPLTQLRKTKSTGSASYGWSGGGSTNGHAGTSTMDRIDYANDTATASARGPLSGTRTNHYAAGAQANAKQGAPSFIPRIRWVDSAAENAGIPLVGPAYGYFAGGLTNSQFTTVDRIDFSSDTGTASPKGNLTYARGRGGGAGNLTHGYIFGGAAYSGTSYSYISRVEYSNDTATVSSVSNLSNRNSWYGYAASVGTVDYGYTGGTDNGGAPAYTGGNSILDRLDYANDTTTASARGSGIFNPIGHGYGTTGNSTHGYFGGGYHGTLGTLSSIRRIDYANDTAALASAGPLGGSARYKGATGNANYGYYNTGAAGSGSNGSGIDRLDYSSDTSAATPKGPLSNSTTTNTAATGDTSYGYFGGRSSGSPLNNWYSTVDRIDYSNDTATASPKGPLSQQRYSCMAFSGKENGLVQLVPTVLAPVQPPFPFPVQLAIPAAKYGYIVGGSGDPSAPNANSLPVQRIDFDNDTVTAAVRAAPGANYNYYANATGNKNYAWSSMGGFSSSCSVLRLDYSNDTATMLSRGQRATPLVGASGPTSSVGGYEECAVGNLDYGYWCGGGKNYSIPANPSTCPNGYIQGFSHIDRLDYSNDTANTLRRSYNTTRTGNGDGCGTNTYGYFVGGGDNQCNGGDTSTVIERLDYSTDTNNSVAKGNLTNAVWRNSAVGNNGYGYSVGGSPGSNSTYVQRIDYSNDTATTAPKGNLSVRRQAPPSTGNQSYGYVTGGSYSDVHTSVERIDYNNDTATAAPKGPLTYKTYYSGGASATENSNHL